MEYNPHKGWDYEDHSNIATVPLNCDLALSQLYQDERQSDSFLIDTRYIHQLIFRDTVPVNHAYFAGNYRGANYQYLVDYEVLIAGYNGTKSHLVESEMSSYSKDIVEYAEKFAEELSSNDQASEELKLITFVKNLSFFFVRFLAIHPYANGNGHIARLVVWALLNKEGYNSDFWTVDKRPDQPLDNCIGEYRRGNINPLIRYFIIGIINNAPVVRV